MRIKSDLLKISKVPFTADGQKLEVEEQAAARVLGTEVGATDQRGNPLGAMRTQIIAETTIGEIANQIRHKCKDCKHFDQPAMVKMIQKAGASGDKRLHQGLNEIRAALLQSQNASLTQMHEGADGDLDVEHALASMGYCRALSDKLNDLIVVHPMAGCPEDTITPQSPHGLFQARSRASEKDASAAYDKLLNLARTK